MSKPPGRAFPTSWLGGAAQPEQDQRDANELPYLDASDDTRIEPGNESPPSTPGWVKLLGNSAIVLLLLLAGLHLTGTAPTHMPGSGGAEHTTQAP